MPQTLRGPRIALRPVKEDDLPRLLAIHREPEVARHWSAPDDAFNQHELLSSDYADGAERVTPFVISMNGETAGWIAGEPLAARGLAYSEGMH